MISRPTAAQPERISIGFFPTALIEESQSYWFEIKDFNLLRGQVSGISVTDSEGRDWALTAGQFEKMKEVMLEYRL